MKHPHSPSGCWLMILLFLSPFGNLGSCENLPIRIPISRIGGDISGFCMEDENHLWAGQGVDLVLFNVSDPKHLFIEVRLPLGENPNQTVKKDEVLFVLGKGRRLWVIDIQDPIHPKIIKDITFDRGAGSFQLLGDQGLILDGSTIKVFDLSNPRDPRQIKEFPMDKWMTLIHTEGTLGFTGVVRDGIHVYDLSNPGEPREVGKYPLDRNATGIATNGSIAFIAEEQMGIHAVDFSDPTQPQKIGYLENQGISGAIRWIGNHLLVPGEKPDLTVYNASDPKNLSLVAKIDFPGGAREVCLHRDRIYLSSEGLKVFDFSQPAQPSMLGEFTHTHNPRSLHCHGAIAYVGGESSNLSMIDFSDPSAPVEKGFLPLSGLPNCLSGTDTCLYVFDSSLGLEVFDLKAPLEPQRVHQDPKYRKVQKFEIHGKMGAALELNGVVQLLDLTDPSHPKWVGQYDPGRVTSHNAEWLGKMMILSTGSSGAQFVDLKYPFSPVFRTLIALEKGISNACLVGSVAILCGQQAPAAWFDISDPFHPVLLGTLDITPLAAFACGNRVFFSGYGGGQEYDFSDPAHVVQIAQFQNGLAPGAIVFNDLIFEPGWVNGMRIFQIDE